jgi:hypothetical protein
MKADTALLKWVLQEIGFNIFVNIILNINVWPIHVPTNAALNTIARWAIYDMATMWISDIC